MGGGTEVVVGMRLEVAGAGKEEGGKVACVVSWWVTLSSTYFHLDWFRKPMATGSSPAAYLSSFLNLLDDLQSDLTILLDTSSELFHPSHRPTNLVIMPGKKVWAEKLDVVMFADGGNIVDCLVLACCPALWDTKIPHTKG